MFFFHCGYAATRPRCNCSRLGLRDHGLGLSGSLGEWWRELEITRSANSLTLALVLQALEGCQGLFGFVEIACARLLNAFTALPYDQHSDTNASDYAKP